MMSKCVLDALKLFSDAPRGDVLAARRCATALLAEIPTFGRDLAGERLLVTAALIHIQSTVEAPPCLRNLSAVLASLSLDGPVRQAFAESPSLLVQYVAAEVMEGGLDPVLAAAASLRVEPTAMELRAPARGLPASPPPGRRRPEPSTRERLQSGVSPGDRT